MQRKDLLRTNENNLSSILANDRIFVQGFPLHTFCFSDSKKACLRTSRNNRKWDLR